MTASEQPLFIHLRNHSAYSLLKGAISVNELVMTAKDFHQPAIAMTDSNNLFGALEFSLTATANHIQPIIGTEISLDIAGFLLKNNQTGEQHIPPYMRSQRGGADFAKIILLAQNEQGYGNLKKIMSRSYLKNDEGEGEGSQKFSLSFDLLEQHHHGIIVLSGGVDGPIGQALQQNNFTQAQDIASAFKNIFQDRFYMEIQRHGLRSERQCEAQFLELADTLDIMLVATNDCHFVGAEMFEAHDALGCISDGRYVSEADRPRLTPEHYLKSSQEMIDLFQDLPEAYLNTAIIAKRCAFAVPESRPILPTYNKLDGRSEQQALKDLANEGLEKRLKIIGKQGGTTADADIYQERLEYELSVINEMGFCGYFLIVADFIQWAKNNDIPVGPGRGSGAGSVVAWALTITDLDPIQFGLLFERFLNPERVSMPDFDIDFCQDLREKVIQYVQGEYGFENVAQIITFGKLQARAVLRDVGRVLQMPYAQVDRICKMVPNNPADPTSLVDALEKEPIFKQEYDSDASVKNLVDMAKQLEGLYRHASTHAAGVVIGDRPLEELVPLYRDPRSTMPVTQFNMKYVEKAGLVKFDFLGLKTLTIIKQAIDLIEMRDDSKGRIDIMAIPYDDKETFDMLCMADVTGVFQLESSGMQDVLKQLKPDRFEDLIAVVALYRPGPMENIPTYIRRKHGLENVQYMHPILEESLAETFGIPIYQEQVMQIAQTLAGYTLGGADLLRRAMGKKDQAEMDKQREIFIKGAYEKNKVDKNLADKVFNEINAFAGYGFNKSHAAAYALLAYQTAWLKAHYPVEFLTASMNLDIHNTDKIALFIKECRRANIRVNLVDVNESATKFTVGYDTDDKGGIAPYIQYALAGLKNVGEGATDKIVQERNDNGEFENIYDFFERVDCKSLNKRMIENIVRAGGFDKLNPNRHQMYKSVEGLMQYAHFCQDEKNSNQVSLFGDDIATDNRPILPDLNDWIPQEKLKHEREAVGLYLSAHPLESYENIFDKLNIISSIDAMERPLKEKIIYMAGMLTSKRVMRNKRGDKLAFLQMSDTYGDYEVVIFKEEILNKSFDLLNDDVPLFLKLSIDDTGDARRLHVLALENLEERTNKIDRIVKIYIDESLSLAQLHQVFNDHGRSGLSKVQLQLKNRPFDDKNADIMVELQEQYSLTSDFKKAIKSLNGIVDIIDA